MSSILLGSNALEGTLPDSWSMMNPRVSLSSQAVTVQCIAITLVFSTASCNGQAIQLHREKTSCIIDWVHLINASTLPDVATVGHVHARMSPCGCLHSSLANANVVHSAIQCMLRSS